MLENLKTVWKKYSFWAVFLFTSAVAYWLSLPLDQQAAVMEAFPQLKWFAPLLGFVAFVIARGVPQPPKE